MNRDGQRRRRISPMVGGRAPGLKRAEIFVDQRRGSGRDDLREYLHVAIEAE
jgi:hypothetical protein